MKFTHTTDYPGTRQAVTEMLRNPSYYRQRWAFLDSDPVVDINESDTSIRVSSTLNVSEHNLEQLANMLNSGLNLKIMEIWDKDETGLITKGTLSAAMAGVPVKVGASVALSTKKHAPQSTKAQFRGNVTCTVPIIGGGVEKAILKQFDAAMQREQDIAKEFLQ